jgi:folate-binding protein YgfZ
MSTNDILKLTPGQGLPTAFLTPIGRIVDLVFVLVRDEDLLLVTGRGADELVAGWLQRHIFFNDDVQVENLTHEQTLIGFRGPGAAFLMGELFGSEIADLALYHTRTSQINGMGLTLVRSAPLGFDYVVLACTDHIPSLWSMLEAAGESVGGAPVGETALEAGRIGDGVPRFARELSDDYIPLEAGLRWAISSNTGCYVGQEIIARMETFQRLAKRLVVLGLEHPSPITSSGAQFREPLENSAIKVVAGDEVRANDLKVGQVTSVAPLAEDGMLKALAYVKTEMAESGCELCVLKGDGCIVATVLAVPGEAR